MWQVWQILFLIEMERMQAEQTPVQVLNVDSNAMHSLPEQLGALTRLERLQAAQNALIGLPSSFARLQALKVLSLAKNKIATVPDAVGDCGRLEELDLSDNCLQVSCQSALNGTATC